MTTAWRVAVVGGGLTGLAVAHKLQELSRAAQRPLDLTLYEAGPRLGGVVGTRTISGYRVETGADSFITNKPWALDLCRRLGLEDRLIPTQSEFRRSLVLRRGRPLPVPDGFLLLAPARIGPILASPLFSWWGKLRLGLEYFLPRGRVRDDESLASFVRRRLGRQALDRLVQPLVGGIYTSDPEKLSLRATLPRFLEMERQYGGLIRGARRQRESTPDAPGGARYGLFATLTQGISEMSDALAKRVRQWGAEVKLDTPIAAVHLASRESPGMGDSGATAEHTLELPDGSHDAFDAVLLALPAYAAAALLGRSDAALAKLLAAIEYASTAVVVSGHKLSDVRDPLEAFGLVIPAIERRRILAVSYASRKFAGRAPAGCVQLRTFVGGALQPELYDLPDKEILRIVRGELEDILGINWRPDFTLVARHARAMPQYHVGHLELVSRIEARIATTPGLGLAGSAYHGVGIPDCIHSGEQASERLFESRTT